MFFLVRTFLPDLPPGHSCRSPLSSACSCFRLPLLRSSPHTHPFLTHILLFHSLFQSSSSSCKKEGRERLVPERSCKHDVRTGVGKQMLGLIKDSRTKQIGHRQKHCKDSKKHLADHQAVLERVCVRVLEAEEQVLALKALVAKGSDSAPNPPCVGCSPGGWRKVRAKEEENGSTTQRRRGPLP